jgi:N-acetylglucosaminyldiphosphoundecaprenol N-acetyl-beta-D-mannosaminyltransferase
VTAMAAGSIAPESDSPRERGEVRLLGVRFDRMSRTNALSAMEETFSQGEARKVYIVNAHTLNLASSNPEYRGILNQADLLFNDGTGTKIASILAGRPFPDNLVGTDLTPQLCERASRRGVGVFLLGGQPGVPEKAGQQLGARVKGLRICGSHHGYFSRSEEAAVVDEINRSGAGILLVAFGNPLQETWIHQNAPKLHCDLCMGVGGLFDHLSGRLRRAPTWMRRLGVEWVHILASQPHKWRRYLIGNPLFMARVVADRIQPRP